jgi:hypothetical protein
LQYLLNMHNLEIICAQRIPTHGGSIRVFAARKGLHTVTPSVQTILQQEAALNRKGQIFEDFKQRVTMSKVDLYTLLKDIKQRQRLIYGVGAPSHASTLINYLGLDNNILNYVLEVKNSYKVDKYMPGTLIPVLDEAKLFKEQPEFALLPS